MDKNKIKKSLDELKVHIDFLESWISHANNLIYSVENYLMDLDDYESSSFYNNTDDQNIYKKIFLNIG